MWSMARSWLTIDILTDRHNLHHYTNLETMEIKKIHFTQLHPVNYIFVIAIKTSNRLSDDLRSASIIPLRVLEIN